MASLLDLASGRLVPEDRRSSCRGTRVCLRPAGSPLEDERVLFNQLLEAGGSSLDACFCACSVCCLCLGKQTSACQ